MRFRRADLSDEEIDAIVERVRKRVEKPAPDAAEENAPDGIIMMLDEPASERTARIASRLLVGTVFETDRDMERYLQKTPGADPTKHSFKRKVTDKAPSPDSGGGGSSKKPGEPSGEFSVSKMLIEKLGDREAKTWSTHKVHESQLTPNSLVQYADGSQKKYGDLSELEKQRVNVAIKNGQVGSKGFNDYSRESFDKDPAGTLKKNMANNLARYDSGKDETKNTSTESVTKDNVGSFVESAKKNGRSVIEKYSKAMSSVSKPMAERFVDEISDTVKEAVEDGSMENVSQADLDEFIREEMKRMVHQEVETRRRSLGDHGIRHAAENAHNTLNMLDELAKAGEPITGKQKLMGMSIQANHDQGYTVGEQATSFSKEHGGHQENSKILAEKEAARYETIFGADDTKKMAEIIGTHDNPEMDWKKEPLASAVRLADNTALFGKEKVQDLFIRSPEAMNQACKLRLAVESEPDNKELQDSIKKQMHETIDKGDFDDTDKELLHAQIHEMSADFTTMDILSRFSGKVEGFSYDKDSGSMNVDMAYSPEGQTVDMLFGDKIATRQFKKFMGDMGCGSSEKAEKGVGCPGGNPTFKLNMKGFDENPIDTATTESMKDFVKNTARTELNQARSSLIAPPTPEKASFENARKALEAAKNKFTSDEWKIVEETLASGDPAKAVEKLSRWPLLESERSYMGKTTASMRRKAMSLQKAMIAAVVSREVFNRFAQLSDEDKAKVTEKVKEKVKGKGDGEQDAEVDAPADEPKPEDKPEDTAEEPAEEPAPEETDTEEQPAEEPADEEPDLGGIVNDLVKEIEAIKSDNVITPSEVLGLVDNIVKMVSSLLTAKPGRARKSFVASLVREEVIASRIVQEEL